MFFEQLDKLCKAQGTNPTAVTLKLGFSKGSMSQWKNGSSPNGDTLLKFADYFGVSTDLLLTGKERNITNEKVSYMKEQVRNQLKHLTKMFKFYRDLDPAKGHSGDIFDDDMLSEEKHIARQEKILNEKLAEWNIKREELHEWSVSNFLNPPTEKQLRYMLSYLKDIYNGEAEFKLFFEQDIINPRIIDEYEGAINDYVYYSKLESDKLESKEPSSLVKPAAKGAGVTPFEEPGQEAAEMKEAAKKLKEKRNKDKSK